MATTLSTSFERRNYSTLPSIDVEIIEDTTVHCEHCNGELVNANHSSHPTPDWQHRVSAAYDHRAKRIARCSYCGAEGTVTQHSHAWYDSVDCSRCGGSVGFPLGD